MELEAAPDDEVFSSNDEMQALWPLGQVDPKTARFPCCIVWTPLPVVSWLAPYIGHVGIAREDGTVLDFAGSNLVSVDDLAYGSVARCLQLDREKCCFPANLAAHVCARSHEHSEAGTAISWDDALQSGARRFEHKCYNLFTCNSHSFVADCLNRVAYGGSVGWNVLNLAALVWLRGRWLDPMAAVRSFLPFAAVSCVGVLMAGWSFLLGMAAFTLLLLGWFVLGVYCMKGLGTRSSTPAAARSSRAGRCKTHGGGRRCLQLGCTKSAEGKTDHCIAHGGGRRWLDGPGGPLEEPGGRLERAANLAIWQWRPGQHPRPGDGAGRENRDR